MGAPTEARKDQVHRAAERHKLGINQLWRASMAVWSNLNPDSVNFDHALSVAIVALAAADHGNERITE